MNGAMASVVGPSPGSQLFLLVEWDIELISGLLSDIYDRSGGIPRRDFSRGMLLQYHYGFSGGRPW